MKRFILASMFICMCLLSMSAVNASAAISTNQPQSLPYTINGTTYTDVVVYYQDWIGRTIWFYYNPVPTSSYNGQTRYTGSAISGGDNTGNNATYCQQYGNDTGTLYCTNYILSVLFNHNGNFTASYTKSSQDIYNSDGTSVVMSANLQSGQTRQLTIVPSPSSGGTVTSDPSGIDCPDTTCQANSTINSDVDITATASTDWAFAYWDNGTMNLYSNPLTVTMDGAKTLTAKFFKTFRNAVGNFRQDIDETGGWCVDYVNYETDITTATGQPFSGDAWTYYQEAIDVGYQTSSIPRVGAIIVFDRDTLPDYGHVGIVTAINGSNITIRDSNWCDPYCYLVKEHTVDVSNYTVHYIYYTP